MADRSIEKNENYHNFERGFQTFRKDWEPHNFEKKIIESDLWAVYFYCAIASEVSAGQRAPLIGQRALHRGPAPP
jgi:hypothetical protein